jgi:hypothetical protein
VADAGLVVAIVTPAFSRSHFCVAELGASWAVTGQLFPLVLPGTKYDTLGGVLAGLAVRPLNDESALDELYDRISEMSVRRRSAQRWGRNRTKWLARVDSYVQDVVGKGGAVISMTACSRTPGHMELFWTDGSGRVFQRWCLQNCGWSYVKDWDGPPALHVAAVSRQQGDQWLFGVGQRGPVWACRWIRDARNWDVAGPAEWIHGDVVGPLSAVRYGDWGLQLSAWTPGGESCYLHRENSQWTPWSTDWSSTSMA